MENLLGFLLLMLMDFDEFALMNQLHLALLQPQKVKEESK